VTAQERVEEPMCPVELGVGGPGGRPGSREPALAGLRRDGLIERRRDRGQDVLPRREHRGREERGWRRAPFTRHRSCSADGVFVCWAMGSSLASAGHLTVGRSIAVVNPARLQAIHAAARRRDGEAFWSSAARQDGPRPRANVWLWSAVADASTPFATPSPTSRCRPTAPETKRAASSRARVLTL